MVHPIDRALQVAAEMERLGCVFYQSLAVGCGQPKIATLARDLAAAEKTHEETFERMRRALPADQRGPKLAEDEMFAAAGEVRGAVLPTAEKVRQVALHGGIVEALEMAIEMEADAVRYYSDLGAKSKGQDAAVIAAIVAEEKTHLRLLQDQHKEQSRPSGRSKA